jgi:hypothetical protein
LPPNAYNKSVLTKCQSMIGATCDLTNLFVLEKRRHSWNRFALQHRHCHEPIDRACYCSKEYITTTFDNDSTMILANIQRQWTCKCESRCGFLMRLVSSSPSLAALRWEMKTK